MRAIKSSPVARDDQYFWDLWFMDKDPEAADYLMRLYEPLVIYHVKRIQVGLPKSVTFDELMSYGYTGLYDALLKFDSARDLKFDTYASIRVRGAILDGLRRDDPMPRTLRSKTKKIEATVERLEQRYQRDVTVEEIAEELEMKPDDIRTVLTDGFTVNMVSMDEAIDAHAGGENIGSLIEDKWALDPMENILQEELVSQLAEILASLTEKEQLVISLFYYEELTLSEIGRVLNLSTSRVSQIHSKALTKLKNVINKEMDVPIR
ncbi:FliA/WhiG family RNA polymerase sigma factor [Camelliibacillus cellulosilyticus]|uniref:FliA/WhiG family RNA polymerase sigma factor n=1 Tax=Camelliibacillus cellulosilyticus TaxID=2174486 RepID=A0ABV9GHK0_9BACL